MTELEGLLAHLSQMEVDLDGAIGRLQLPTRLPFREAQVQRLRSRLEEIERQVQAGSGVQREGGKGRMRREAL